MSGCAIKNEVTFEKLFSNPQKYNGKSIVFEGFYFQGFESNLLCEGIGPSGYAEGHLTPKGNFLWVEGGLPLEIYNQLYQQNMMGPSERFGKVRIKGIFNYGGKFGHMGAFSYQITLSEVELLPWTPSR